MTGQARRIVEHAPPIASPVVTVIAGAVALFLCYFALTLQTPTAGVGDDFHGYTAAMERFVETGSPYASLQLTGTYNPWELHQWEVFLHPPTAIPMMLPFLVLPAGLWWAVPIGIVAWSVWSYRPAAWAWALIGVCVFWPRSWGALLLGNTDMWVAAGVAAGLRWAWPAALILLKPTFAPFALIGIRHRFWWVAVAVIAVVSLLFLPLWREWFETVRNGAGLGYLYSITTLLLACIPLIAWAGASTGGRLRPNRSISS